MPDFHVSALARSSVFLLAIALPSFAAENLARLEANYHPAPEDEALLAPGSDRQDLRCDVSATKPEMEFDLRFHTGYVVALPLKSLAGEGNHLRILVRVAPLDSANGPFFLRSEMPVPPIDSDVGGETELSGEYVVGPGRYRIDWLMRDRGNRVCSAHWTIEAKVKDDYADVPLPIQPGTVEEAPQDGFRQLAPVPRDPKRPMRVKVLINFSPGEPGQAVLEGRDLRAITAMLRAVAREPSFGRFSIVAFSMEEERVFYRQPEAPEIDFPALGDAVKKLKFGTVDYDLLRNPDRSADFLASVLTENLGPQPPTPDAIVIISSKVMLDKKLARDKLIEAGQAQCPIFYMNYNANPLRHPWRDAISAALKAYRGVEYSITGPRDLGSALSKMMSRLRVGQ